MSLELRLIDAFADTAFAGNPAGIVRLTGPVSDAWMQSVAMEMNQAETAFLLHEGPEWSLRWFTPMAEVDLCGHATLASAHHLWEEGVIGENEAAVFRTRSGQLIARRSTDGRITIDLPAIQSRPVAAPFGLNAALGATPQAILRGDFDLICVVDSAATVRAIAPDLPIVAKWDTRGLIVTAQSDSADEDFISRCFFPGLGINEDPVTGSAHCALAVYWRTRLQKEIMVGYQASRRGGRLTCEVRGDRVLLTGRAVTTLRGSLLA